MSTSATETQDHSIAPQQTYVPPENQEKYQPGIRDENELQKQQTQLVSSVRPGPGIKANPGPLGLFGFATTTFVLGLYQCGAGCVDLPSVLFSCAQLICFQSPSFQP